MIVEGFYSSLEAVREKAASKKLRSSDISNLRLSSAYFFRAAENANVFVPTANMIRENQPSQLSGRDLRKSLSDLEKEIYKKGVRLNPGQLSRLMPPDGLSHTQALELVSKSPISIGANFDHYLKDLETILQASQSVGSRKVQSVSATPEWCYQAGIAVAELAAIGALAGLACYMSEGAYVEACTTAAVFGAAAAVAALAMAMVCVAH